MTLFISFLSIGASCKMLDALSIPLFRTLLFVASIGMQSYHPQGECLKVVIGEFLQVLFFRKLKKISVCPKLLSGRLFVMNCKAVEVDDSIVPMMISGIY